MDLGMCNYLNTNHYSYIITITENPCVPGSIPGDTTENKAQVIVNQLLGFYFFLQLLKFEGILKTTSKGSGEIFGT